MIAKAELAKVEVQEKRTQEAIASLRQLIQQADDLGLKYISVESSISMAEAMMQSHDLTRMPGRNWSGPCCSRISSECNR